MSFKRRLQYKYQYFLNFLRSLHLPAWMSGMAVRVGLVTLVAGLSVAYVFQTSNLSTSGYEIHKLENKVANLTTDNQRLEAEMATLQSMNSIQSRLSEVKMVAAVKVKRIVPVGDFAMAK